MCARVCVKCVCVKCVCVKCVCMCVKCVCACVKCVCVLCTMHIMRFHVPIVCIACVMSVIQRLLEYFETHNAVWQPVRNDRFRNSRMSLIFHFLLFLGDTIIIYISQARFTKLER